MKEESRVAIIGAGPAGLAAAIQLTRQGHNPQLFESDEPGGLLRNANLVENYPGFPGGITGLDLAKHFVDQAGRVGVKVISAEVQKLDHDGSSFGLATNNGGFEADIVVVASGTVPKPFEGVPLPASIKDRVYYEVADLLSVKGNKILILGAGDAALDYALNLGRRNQVTILNRSSHIRGLSLLWQRVQKSPSIRYFEGHEVVDVMEGEGGKVSLGTRSRGGTRRFQADFLIPAIGRRPAKDFLTKRVKNHLDHLEATGKLSFIGDVVNDRFRQTAIAVGDGLRVAMEIEDLLMGDKH